MTDQSHGRSLTCGCDDLRAFFKYERRLFGQEADELFAIRLLHRGAGEGALADEVRLALADGPSESEVIWCERAVGILSDDDEALLGAQDVHGLGAVRREAVIFAGSDDGIECRLPVGGGDIHLETEFAGEAHAKEHHRQAAQGATQHGHVR